MTSGIGSTSSRRSGLTLIELILVMVLMLAMLAMVAPRLDAFSRGRVLNSQAETVLAMLQTARDRAAADGAMYRVEFDTDSGVCRILRQSGGTFEPLASSPEAEHRLPEDLRLRMERLDASDQGFVEFRPTGECTPARVQVQQTDGASVVLTAQTPLEPFHLAQDNSEESP